jgi:hypothetical protein
VRRDQALVERWNWGSATPIDPGAYVVQASAPGKKTWSVRVNVPATATQTVSLTIPPLEDATAQCEPSAESAEPSQEPRTQPVHEKARPPLTNEAAPQSARRTGYALALVGLGVASAGAGTILGLEYKSKNDDAKTICPAGSGCSGADIDGHAQLVSDAKTFRTWSFVGFGVGGAALIGAAVLYFAPKSNSSATSGWLAAPFVSQDGAWGATALGHF